MTVHHHPGDDLLLGYVTCALSYPMEVIIAAHLTLCPHCRDTLSGLESLGGELLEELQGSPAEKGELTSVIARLDEAEAEPAVDTSWENDPASARLIPAPIRVLAGQRMHALPWRQTLPGVAVVDMASLREQGAKARLVRTQAGGSLPRHIHKGAELTLVLAGGMTEQHGHFRRGDLLVIEPGEIHRPVMDDDEDCLCLGVTDGKVVMTGVISRLRQIVSGY